MATPREPLDPKMVEAILAYPAGIVTSLRDEISGPRQGLPKHRGFWFRIWCGLRGHGGITPFPGDTFYMRDALCKRCGARVSLTPSEKQP